MPILAPNTLEFFSRSPEQTRRVGMRLGAALDAGDTVCLVGELGSGKTTFVQGIAAGWGSLDTVTSPTFVLVNLYRRTDGQQLAHLDAYRLSSPAEAVELDVDLLLESGPLVVEWADRIQAALPGDHLRINLGMVAEEQRRLLLSYRGARYEKMLETLRHQLFGIV
jgi:tRNA threonylcarbamoyladenosine biosynthesis protein TsaE